LKILAIISAICLTWITVIGISHIEDLVVDNVTGASSVQIDCLYKYQGRESKGRQGVPSLAIILRISLVVHARPAVQDDIGSAS